MNNPGVSYEVIGLDSKKLYVKGESRAACLRKLKDEYPEFEHGSKRRKKGFRSIYPETLIINRL